jgi:hypothetical protein
VGAEGGAAAGGGEALATLNVSEAGPLQAARPPCDPRHAPGYFAAFGFRARAVVRLPRAGEP